MQAVKIDIGSFPSDNSYNTLSQYSFCFHSHAQRDFYTIIFGKLYCVWKFPFHDIIQGTAWLHYILLVLFSLAPTHKKLLFFFFAIIEIVGKNIYQFLYIKTQR